MSKGRPKNYKTVSQPEEVVVAVSVEKNSTGLPQEERETFSYSVPETKKDWLALYELLLKLGVTRISQVENEIARL